MKTLSHVSSILAVIVFASLIGCSDEIFSPSELSTSSNQKQESTSSVSDQKVPSNHYEKKFTMKNRESVAFAKSNTGIAVFKAITINDCNNVKKLLDITGSIGDIMFEINCNSKGFSATEIVITNVSGREFDIDLQLFGDVDIVNPPGIRGTKNE